MIFFAETTINIASLCITCNGSIAVQSLKTRTVCKMKVNYVTKKTVFPCLKITTSFEFLTLKNLNVNFFYKGVQTKIHYYIFVKYSMRI